MNQNIVDFRYGTPVTSSSPELIPGSFLFDSSSLALYLDTDSGRVQVMDPLKLSLTGGDVTGTINVINNGATVASLNTNGVVSGKFLESTGSIALNTAPNLYAVFDSNGRIRTRTKAEMILDLRIIDPDSLGSLAYKNSAQGTFTPVGTISTPTITINYSNESVVKSVTSGELPEYTVSGEVLSLTSGTQLTTTSTNVMSAITSVQVSQPTFTGTESTITVS